MKSKGKRLNNNIKRLTIENTWSLNIVVNIKSLNVKAHLLSFLKLFFNFFIWIWIEKINVLQFVCLNDYFKDFKAINLKLILSNSFFKKKYRISLKNLHWNFINYHQFFQSFDDQDLKCKLAQWRCIFRE